MSGETIEQVVDDGNLDAEGEAGGDGEQTSEDGDQRSEDGDQRSDDGDDPDEGDPEEHEAGGVKFSQEQQKAVNGLLAKEKRSRKEVEGKLAKASRELEDFRKRYGEADGETVLKAAQAAGVLPELITAQEADGVTKLENAKSNQKFFERLLRRSGDEFDVGGKKMTRDEVEAGADQWEAEVERLESRFGGVKARAASAAQEIWKLGLAAKKAGFDPKRRPVTGDGKRETGDGKRGTGNGTRGTGPGVQPPARAPAAGSSGKVDWSKVSSGEMSLEEAIAAADRKGGK